MTVKVPQNHCIQLTRWLKMQQLGDRERAASINVSRLWHVSHVATWYVLQHTPAGTWLPGQREVIFPLVCKRTEVAQKLQTHFLTLFRVELRGKEIIFRYHGCKINAVIRSSRDDRCVFGLNIIWMHKIHIWTIWNIPEDRYIWFPDIDLVPSYMWHL